MIELAQANAYRIPLRDESVHCIVTSPPYFGLRRYSGQQEADWPGGAYAPCTGAPACIEVPAMRCGFGNEPTIEAYVWHSLLVLNEFWRVLRPDGVCWYNLGDSFASAGGERTEGSHDGGTGRAEAVGQRITVLDSGNLLGVPARVMLAAQADGFTVRNDCVWAKAALMPESVRGTRWERHRILLESQSRSSHGGKQMLENPSIAQPRDLVNQPHAKYTDCPGCADCEPNGGYVLRRGAWRHTRAHEFVFQLTKGMSYWSDSEIAKEAAVMANGKSGFGGPKNFDSSKAHTNNPGKAWNKTPRRNPRSVLTPRGDGGYPGAHYAVYPESLIAPLILSSTPRRCCSVCGAGWAAVVETKFYGDARNGRRDNDDYEGKNIWRSSSAIDDYESPKVVGYRPTCSHADAAPIPGTLLDPFVGSGTTLKVARELGLNAIGLDISHEYLERQAKSRGQNKTSIRALDDLPLFAALEETG